MEAIRKLVGIADSTYADENYGLDVQIGPKQSWPSSPRSSRDDADAELDYEDDSLDDFGLPKQKYPGDLSFAIN